MNAGQGTPVLSSGVDAANGNSEVNYAEMAKKVKGRLFGLS